jgi:hypothetical protein
VYHVYDKVRRSRLFSFCVLGYRHCRSALLSVCVVESFYVVAVQHLSWCIANTVTHSGVHPGFQHTESSSDCKLGSSTAVLDPKNPKICCYLRHAAAKNVHKGYWRDEFDAQP